MNARDRKNSTDTHTDRETVSNIPERVEDGSTLRAGTEHRIVADWRHVWSLLEWGHH